MSELRACPRCKATLPNNARKIYCSANCRTRAHDKRKRQSSRDRPSTRWCLWCGESLSSRRDITSECCSEPCLVSYYEDIGADWIFGHASTPSTSPTSPKGSGT